MSEVHPFPLRPSTQQAKEQTVLNVLAQMGLRGGLVIAVDQNNEHVVLCDPNLTLGQALYLMEQTRFRLMGAYVAMPPPVVPG